MKHLRLFENFNENDIDSICKKYGIKNYLRLFEEKQDISKYINWDLIDMAKELSLEYLDNGYTGQCEVIYYSNGGVKYIIFDNEWAHNYEEDVYLDNAAARKVLKDGIDKSKISYNFYIFKVFFDPYKVINIRDNEIYEFISILESAFPNENIKYHH